MPAIPNAKLPTYPVLLLGGPGDGVVMQITGDSASPPDAISFPVPGESQHHAYYSPRENTAQGGPRWLYQYLRTECSDIPG
jgi:hypothetical protein